MDEVIQAGQKHKDAALALKEVAGNLKQKVVASREREARLMDEIDNLEMEVSEKHHFAMQLAKKRKDLENEVKDIGEKLEISKEEKLKLKFIMEKQKNLSNGVIHVLKEEIKVLQVERRTEIEKFESLKKKALTEYNGYQSEKETINLEIDALKDEIGNLRNSNEEKEKQIQDLMEENKSIAEKLDSILDRHEVLIENTFEVQSVLTLKEELDLCLQTSHCSDRFKCKDCELTFHTKFDLRNHRKDIHVKEINAKMCEYERNILAYSRNIAHSIFKLKKKETKERYEPCRCKSSCNINHNKYNWTKPKSDLIISKLEESSVIACFPGEKEFTSEDHLEVHVEVQHTMVINKVNHNVETKSKLRSFHRVNDDPKNIGNEPDQDEMFSDTESFVLSDSSEEETNEESSDSESGEISSD